MTPEIFFSKHKKVAVAYSGGTDSAYLLYLACKYGCEVHAFYVESDFQPSRDLQKACEIISEINGILQSTDHNASCSLTFHKVYADVLSEEEITINPANRCYFCKKKMFTEIKKAAAAYDCDIIMDGTNASDDEDDRPGMKALKELGIYSPLREWGFNKDYIRFHSKETGLSTWNKPAAACLATRIPTGTAISKKMLTTTEVSEAFLSCLGFSDFRIRFLGDAAKIQVQENQLDLLLQHRKKILKELSAYYSTVTLDLETRS